MANESKPRSGWRKLTIASMQELAALKRGQCLSKEYTNAHAKLRWRCAMGHEWDAKSNAIQQGHWCPVCARNQQNANIREAVAARQWLRQLKELAQQRGGKCLSAEYVSSKKKLKWQCAKGHIWESSPEGIRSGRWCPLCSRSAKGSISEMIGIARSRGGECLSREYINSHRKLSWRCAHNHTWEASPTSIKSGSWCPECSSSISERICRIYFETMFGAPFPKTRLPWLTNADGNQMELDGYSDTLKLAFEHQGLQHYRLSKYFHHHEDTFNKRVSDDRQKAALCAEHGVRLIHIPQLFKVVRLANLRGFIEKHAKTLDVAIQCRNVDIEMIDITKAYHGESPDFLAQMCAFAEAKGGKCFSERYMNTETPLLWRCSQGHMWKAEPQRVQQGSWCPVCAGNAKLSIEEMRRLASARGGKCLSDHYVNAQTRLTWQCSRGHVWEAFPYSVKRGLWCRMCKRHRFTEEMHRIAETREGKCLSAEYVDSRIKLRWQCAKGHTWESLLGEVRRGGWCPVCKKLTGAASHKGE